MWGATTSPSLAMEGLVHAVPNSSGEALLTYSDVREQEMPPKSNCPPILNCCCCCCRWGLQGTSTQPPAWNDNAYDRAKPVCYRLVHASHLISSLSRLQTCSRKNSDDEHITFFLLFWLQELASTSTATATCASDLQ